MKILMFGASLIVATPVVDAAPTVQRAHPPVATRTTCAVGYVTSLNFLVSPGSVAGVAAIVDQTGVATPATATFAVSARQRVAVETARWENVRGALVEALRSRFPVLVTTTGSCTDAADVFEVKLCSNQADCTSTSSTALRERQVRHAGDGQ